MFKTESTKQEVTSVSTPSCKQLRSLARVMYEAKKNQAHAIDLTTCLGEAFSSFATKVQGILMKYKDLPYSDTTLNYGQFLTQMDTLSQSFASSGIIFSQLGRDVAEQRRVLADNARDIQNHFEDLAKQVEFKRHQTQQLWEKAQQQRVLVQNGQKGAQEKYAGVQTLLKQSVDDTLRLEQAFSSNLRHAFPEMQKLDAQRLQLAQQWTEASKQVFRKMHGDIDGVLQSNFMLAQLDVEKVVNREELGDVEQELEITTMERFVTQE